MKNGIEWAATLPPRWKAARLRLLAEIFAGGTPDKSQLRYWEGGTIPWLNSGSVNDSEITRPSAWITEDAYASSSARWIPAKSIVIALAGQGRTKGLAARLEFRSTANQSMAAIVPSSEIEYRYIQFWLSSNYQNIRNLAGGDKRDGLNLVHIGSIQCPVPPLAEQKRIADYLDRETGEIDAMLAKMDELTATLEARRTSVIDRALLPHVGVSTARLGLVAEAITGLTYVPADVVDSGGTVVHRSGSIQNSRIDRSDLIRVVTAIPERLRLRCGDLLVCSRNGSAHLVGKNALIGAREVEETWGAFMTVLRSPNNRYLRWYLQSTLFADERSQYSTSTINQLTIGMINRMEIPFPDSAEQIRIADHLDEVTGKIDQMLAKTAELKDLLIERRAALITDVVTGKKQVL